MGLWESIVNFAFMKAVWNQVKQFFEINQKQSQFSKATQKYYEHYQNRHGIVKVLGSQEPTKLDSIYTTVWVLYHEENQQFNSIGSLEEQNKKRIDRDIDFYQNYKQKRQRGIDIAQKKQYLIVLGQPGMGKSIFLKKMGLEALQEKYWQFEVRTKQDEIKIEERRCTPVLLEIKNVDIDIDSPIKTAIVNELANCGFPRFEKRVEKYLKEGQLLVLFDGLDEIGNHSHNQVATVIEDFVDRYPHNRYIVSCRTAAYCSQFRRFTDVTIDDFDDEQVNQFIYNWFSSQEDKKAKTAKQLWELLQEPEWSSVNKLARTPLLLTYLCHLYQKNRVILTRRRDLYYKVLNIILEDWVKHKRIKQDEIYQGLHPDLEIKLLAEIAYLKFKEKKHDFPREDILKKITNFLKNELGAPKSLNARAVLQAIEEQQGILIKQNEEIYYSFSHLTLQEYLTAYYIEENQLVEKMVDEHFGDYQWQEVFLLVAEGGRAYQLLQKMAERVKDYLDTEKLQNLIKWIDTETTTSNSNNKLITKRGAAILFLTWIPCLKINQSSTPDMKSEIKFYSHNIFLSISRSKTFSLQKFPPLTMSQLKDEMEDKLKD